MCHISTLEGMAGSARAFALNFQARLGLIRQALRPYRPPICSPIAVHASRRWQMVSTALSSCLSTSSLIATDRSAVHKANHFAQVNVPRRKIPSLVILIRRKRAQQTRPGSRGCSVQFAPELALDSRVVNEGNRIGSTDGWQHRSGAGRPPAKGGEEKSCSKPFAASPCH